MADNNDDFSKAFDKLGEMLSNEEGQKQIQDIIGMLGADKTADESHNSADNSDVDMLFKAKAIMSSMKKGGDNESAKFLKSLKPLLKPSRRGKVDQAIKILGMGRALGVIKKMKGDE